MLAFLAQTRLQKAAGKKMMHNFLRAKNWRISIKGRLARSGGHGWFGQTCKVRPGFYLLRIMLEVWADKNLWLCRRPHRAGLYTKARSAGCEGPLWQVPAH
jgi:hypothetical protein